MDRIILNNKNSTNSDAEELLTNDNNENKKIFQLKINNINLSQTNHVSVWKFLKNKKLNIFDMKDIYNKQEIGKIINKKELFTTEIDILNYTLNEKFLENNDIKFLESMTNLNILGNKNKRRNSIKIINDQPETKHIDWTQFFELLNSSNSFIKKCVLDFCDIYTLTRIGLVNKKFYKFIFSYCNLTESTKMLCEAIFKDSGLFKNYEHELIKVYGNSHLNMINKKPRVFYTGVYTEKLTNILGVKDKINPKKHIPEDKKIYLRTMYFLPNGEVYSLVVKYNTVNFLLITASFQKIHFLSS